MSRGWGRPHTSYEIVLPVLLNNASEGRHFVSFVLCSIAARCDFQGNQYISHGAGDTAPILPTGTTDGELHSFHRRLRHNTGRLPTRPSHRRVYTQAEDEAQQHSNITRSRTCNRSDPPRLVHTQHDKAHRQRESDNAAVTRRQVRVLRVVPGFEHVI